MSKSVPVVPLFLPRDLDTDNVFKLVFEPATDGAGVCMGRIRVFGLDLGKVLAGIQAPEQDSAQFDEFLHELGYPYVEETHNEVYRRYLRK